MATARLRKAVKYPESDDGKEPLEGIDEEEQDKIIKALKQRDEEDTTLYRRIFLVFPFLCSLFYIPKLYEFYSFVSFTSILLSAYTLYFVPLVPGTPKTSVAYLYGHKMWQKVRDTIQEDGPFNKSVIPLNGILAVTLAVRGYVRGFQSHWQEKAGTWAAVPIVVYMLILAARSQMRPIDTKELEDLRYKYKGA